jgi:RNA polymerase sigma factor (sigma-70 family)
MRADSATLVLRARARSEPAEARVEAFSELVRRFQDFAYGCAYGVLGNTALAEEVAQDAFVTAWQRLDQVRDPASFPGWLRRIVVTHARRLTRGEHLEIVALENADGIADPRHDVRSSERRADEDVLISLAGRLPEHERVVTILHYVCGYGQAEIAGFLGLTESAVAKRLFSARRRLRAHATAAFGGALGRSRPSRDELFERRVRGRLRPFADHDRSSLTVLAHAHHPGEQVERALWLQRRYASDPPGRTRQQYVVERSGTREIVAFGAIEQTVYRPRYTLFLVADPRWLDGGAGDLLLDRLEADLRAADAITVSFNDYGSRTELHAFLEARGFSIADRVWDLRRPIDEDAAVREDGDAADGIRISTLREERESDPACIEKLYALMTRVKQDDPAQAGVALPAFNRTETLLWLELPYVLPDAYFIAVHGGEYVGVSDLHLQGAAPGQLVHGFAGVLEPYRRRGLARRLLQAGVHYAQRHGHHTLRAFVQPRQAAGLALATACGYQRRFSHVRLEKCLRPTVPLGTRHCDAYAGDYHARDAGSDLRLRVSAEHGRLFVEFNGQKPELFAESERTFFVKWFYGMFEFVADPGQRARGLIWRTQDRNGKDVGRLCATRVE